jgi:hypothetical protein
VLEQYMKNQILFVLSGINKNLERCPKDKIFLSAQN